MGWDFTMPANRMPNRRKEPQVMFDLEEARDSLEKGHDTTPSSSKRNENGLSHSTKSKSEDDVMKRHSGSKSMSNGSVGSFLRGEHHLGPLLFLIFLLGLGTSAAFLGIGITEAIDDHKSEFRRSSKEATRRLEANFEEYTNAAAFVHARCRSRNFTRSDFRDFYEYFVASGLQVKAMQFDPNITHAERPSAEEEARQYYAKNYPNVDYQGFRGFNTLNSTIVEPRTNESFYFPIHYMEPVAGNEAAIGLDYHSSESRIRTLMAALEGEGPSMTDRLTLVSHSVNRCGHPGSFGVVLMHPGIPLSNSNDVWPRDISSIVLCVTDLLEKSLRNHDHKLSLYIHDLSHPSGKPSFLGAATSSSEEDGVEFFDEIEFSDLKPGLKKKYYQQEIQAANRVWAITIYDEDDHYDGSILLLCLGGAVIIITTVVVMYWIYSSSKKTKRYNEERAKADHEKSSLILENARQATKMERELNDFIAHEVRNPVAAAMGACSFVDAEIRKKIPFEDPENLIQAREDVGTISTSLRFVNDLLRNMLDMHRAASKQLKVDMGPVHILHDVLEPVSAMLYQRGSKVKLIVECSEDLVVFADCLRLKQVILNLGRNSTKFIDKGFIRLKAEESDGSVKIYVDDSGSGIPLEKRELLFAKFQESLDVLSQGTGIGLFLCKSLIELMGGKIYLDDNYESGIIDCPGTRFVVDFCAKSLPPIKSSGSVTLDVPNLSTKIIEDSSVDSRPTELPDELSVLFVDDDSVLRKLFTRAVKKCRPNWTIRQAANGETSLQLIETEKFDLIFMDMYMASVEKQLLGTETVVELRNCGVDCRIIGLSANDKEEEFLEAGADSFLIKPFPCDIESMTKCLHTALYGN